MDFVFRRSYRGRLRAAIFDWAGTTMDYGCCAPAVVFVDLFRRKGIDVPASVARGPMGTAKREHIRLVSLDPGVSAQWTARFGAPCSEADVDDLYREFVPMQLDVIAAHAELIPGANETMWHCRNRGMKIGSTTGYNREMLEICLREGARQGYRPDSAVSASDVPAARPAPWMCVKSAMELGAYPFEACVKIGDTVPDVDEGLNAGMWTIALAACGNEVGLSRREAAETPAAELAARTAAARARLAAAGAHFVVDSIGDVPAILDEIDGLLGRGERP